jgi:mRNA interferase RelE/StbE
VTKSLWSLEFSKSALKQLEKLDKQAARSIITYLETRLVTSEDPRVIDKALRGDMGEFWRYRVGDYRIIVDIIDHRFIVHILKVGHRKDV